MATYREVFKNTIAEFSKAGLNEPESDAQILTEAFLGMTRTDMFLRGDMCVPEEMLQKFNDGVSQRLTGKPVQYITGVQEFCGLEFKVNKYTLIPRFDTEILVEQSAPYVKNKSVLDMCSGTGCIGIAIERIYGTNLSVGCDLIPEAVMLSQENAKNLGSHAEFFCGDLFDALQGTKYENYKFDVIISNPPYIESAVIDTLSTEVRDFEPMSALDGTEDGLEFYRRITKEAVRFLTDGGMLLYEIGYNQGTAVSSLMRDYGFSEIKVVKDYAGLDRVVLGKFERK